MSSENTTYKYNISETTMEGQTEGVGMQNIGDMQAYPNMEFLDPSSKYWKFMRRNIHWI